MDKDGFALYFSRSAIPHNSASRGFPVPVYHKHIGIYAYQTEFLIQFSRMAPGKLEGMEKLEQLRALENGYRIKVVETKYDTISVDRPEDLERVRRLI